MKKSLIALAVLASAAGLASAQSSVTLFGIVDATVNHISNSGGASVTQLTNSGYNSSRLGFRGVEDLGGGNSASFWLEAGVNNDNGSGANTNLNNQPGAANSVGGGGLTFNRRSTVSLAGGWGELRLGRDYTPQFWNMTVFDPFGTNGIGTNLALTETSVPTAVRASNSIGYFLPANLGGFYGQVQYYLGERPNNTPNKDDGTGYGLRLGYANGPFDVAIASGRTKYLAGNADQSNIAGQWNFGVATLQAQYEWDKNTFYPGAAGANLKARGYLVGALVPVGPGQIRFSYAQYKIDAVAGTDPEAKKVALGYVHNLSKRTALYATYARVSNNSTSAIAAGGGAGNPGAGSSSNGYDLGIRHSF
ncbi:MAG TPA: porin [Rhodocyclaceae bacterium]